MKRAATTTTTTTFPAPSLSTTPMAPLLPLDPAPNQVPSQVPNPAAFPYRDWLAAKNELETALRRGPCYGMVTGASGTGKTSLCHVLTASLDDRQLLYLSASRVSLLGVVRFFAQVLRVVPRRSSIETIKVLVDVIKDRATRPVLWIDEADRLPTATLTELRSLVEADPAPTPLLSLILSGPPELRAQLEAPELFPLKRRLVVRAVLDGLRRDELDPFLGHRFGDAARRVPASQKDELFERTRGAPALVHRVVAYALGRTTKTLGDSELREALDAAGL
jgi:type II secretory pathway predicted ATPase ExeA